MRPGVLQQAERQGVLDVLHTLSRQAASPSAAEAAMVATASIVNKAPGGEMHSGLRITLRTAPLPDCIEDKEGAGGKGRGCIVVESHAECCSSPSLSPPSSLKPESCSPCRACTRCSQHSGGAAPSCWRQAPARSTLAGRGRAWASAGLAGAGPPVPRPGHGWGGCGGPGHPGGERWAPGSCLCCTQACC